MFAHVGCKIGEVLGHPGGQNFRPDHGRLKVAMPQEVAGATYMQIIILADHIII